MEMVQSHMELSLWQCSHDRLSGNEKFRHRSGEAWECRMYPDGNGYPPKVDRLDLAWGLSQVCQSLELRIHRQSIDAMEEIAPAVITTALCIA
jgi:hypothetical protein